MFEVRSGISANKWSAAKVYEVSPAERRSSEAETTNLPQMRGRISTGAVEAEVLLSELSGCGILHSPSKRDIAASQEPGVSQLAQKRQLFPALISRICRL